MSRTGRPTRVFADLRRTVEPASLPVSVAELKLHARVETDADDTLIAIYLAAAVDRVENETRRSIMPQTHRLTLHRWPQTGLIPLPYPPTVAVSSVSYGDADGEQGSLNVNEYRLFPGEPAHLAPARATPWPAVDAEGGDIQITYTAGYADAGAVPDSIKAAILLMATHLYEHRVEVVMGGTPIVLPSGVKHLLSRHIVPELTTEMEDA